MIAMNKIGDQGASYLAEALLFNNVCRNISIDLSPIQYYRALNRHLQT